MHTDTSHTRGTETTESSVTESQAQSDTMQFVFLSGAGAWRTVLDIHPDGSFTGWYLDSEMGAVGEGYPKGIRYVCDFSGKFENIEKADAYSYKMTLASVNTKETVGKEWIEDGIRYIASEPYGILNVTTNYGFFSAE